MRVLQRLRYRLPPQERPELAPTKGCSMTDSAPIKLPASRIDPDVETTMDAAPYQPVDWDSLGTVADRLDDVMRNRLMELKGIL